MRMNTCLTHDETGAATCVRNMRALLIFSPCSLSCSLALFSMPFLGEWHDRCHREMFLYSRVSHWLHKWASILEKNLLAAGVEFDTSVPPHMHSIILTADQEEKFLNIPGMDQGALPEPLPVEKSMVIVDVQEAMGYCNCEYSAKARQIDLSVETKHYLEGSTQRREPREKQTCTSYHGVCLFSHSVCFCLCLSPLCSRR